MSNKKFELKIIFFIAVSEFRNIHDYSWDVACLLNESHFGVYYDQVLFLELHLTLMIEIIELKKN